MKKQENINEDGSDSSSNSSPYSPNHRKKFWNRKSRTSNSLILNLSLSLKKHKYNLDYIMQLLEKEPMQRTKIENRILSDNLSERFEFFKKFKKEPSILEKLVSVLHFEIFQANEIIIKFGEEGDKFYILLHGKVILYKPTYPEKKMSLQNYLLYLHNIKNEEKDDSKMKRLLEKNYHLQLDMPKLLSLPISNINSRRNVSVFIEEYEKFGEFTDGFSFGDIALIKKTTRNATIKAKKLSKLVSIHKNDYNKIIRELEEKRLEKVLNNFKKNYPLFKYWTLSLLIKLMNSFSTVYLFPGDYLYKQDEESDSIYIIESGKFEIYTLVSLGWMKNFLEYIKDSKSNLIYLLYDKNYLKENELYNILLNAKNNSLKSPMINIPFIKNKFCISNPKKANIEDLEKEREDVFSPSNLFKIKIRDTNGKEILGFVDSLELKKRLCFVKCIETAKVQKVKLLDFIKLINLNNFQENKKLIMNIISKKKQFFYLQIETCYNLRLDKEENYFKTEFENFLEKKGKYKEENINILSSDYDKNKKEKNDSKKKSSTSDRGKKTIELNEPYINIKPFREFLKKNYKLQHENNKIKNSCTSIPYIRSFNNNLLSLSKSKFFLLEKKRNKNSSIEIYNNTLSSNNQFKNGFSFSTSSLFNQKNELSKSNKEINTINGNQNDFQSQFLIYKNSKPMLYEDDNFSLKKSSKNLTHDIKTNDLFINSEDNKKNSFNIKLFRRNIDNNSKFLKTQICKLTGMKKSIPKKEFNYTIYNDDDRNLIQIKSEVNITNKRNSYEFNIFQKKKNLTKNYSNIKKNFPKILTEIDLKDFRNLRRKHKKFFKTKL